MTNVALIAGGTGFIGGRLTFLLRQQEWEIRILSSDAKTKKENSEKTFGVEYFGYEEIESAVRGITHFFYLAVVYDRPNIADEEIHQVNILTPLSLIGYIKIHQRDTICIVGDSFYRKFPDSATKQPRYTASKRRLFELASINNRSESISLAFCKIEQVYGPGESLSKVLPNITHAMLRNADHIPLTTGRQKRDFVHVDDVAAALLVIARSSWTGTIEIECGSGKATAVRDVFLRIKELTKSKSLLGFGDIIQDQKIDESKADLKWLYEKGWRCTKSLDDGLTELIEDVRSRETPNSV